MSVRAFSLFVAPLVAMHICFVFACAQDNKRDKKIEAEQVHPETGTVTDCGELRLTLAAKLQNYKESNPKDPYICSPKSVIIHSDSARFYVNSLEGCLTAVYRLEDFSRHAVIKHNMTQRDSCLWAPESGLFFFSKNYDNPRHFLGKPVESTFSHNGRYLWTTYYRRSFDKNAQEPSAVVCVNTATNQKVRLFETGVLPKMIAASGDGKYLAISHWGDNTVALMDVSSEDPQMWHYVDMFTIENRLKLNFDDSAKPVNRDVGSGYCLRGTVFTPDGRYLLVACMGSDGGIAVIDLKSMSYRGRIMGCKSNIRHILIHGGYLYLSANAPGYVQRIALNDFESAIEMLPQQSKMSVVHISGWESCKVCPGTRTICISPDGRHLFAACHAKSCIAVVRTSDFKMISSVPVDSYPVGLAISSDGKTLISTSQAVNLQGGNAVDIFNIEYLN